MEDIEKFIILFTVSCGIFVTTSALIVNDSIQTSKTREKLNETISKEHCLDKFTTNYTFLKYYDADEKTTATIYGEAVLNGETKNIGFKYLLPMETKEDQNRYKNLLTLITTDDHLDYTEGKAYKYINELITLVNEGTLIDSFKLTDEQSEKLKNQIVALLNDRDTESADDELIL